MKKIGLVLWLISCQCFASSSYVNPGSSLTTGPSSNHFSIFAASNNPGMAPLMVGEDEQWRINYFPSISVNAELGNVDNFADDLDELIDIIDDSSSLTESANETLDRFNEVLERMGENGYIKNSVNIRAPILPLYFYSEQLGGTIYTDLSIGAQAALRILDARLSQDPQNDKYRTSTSLYLKSGIETRLSVGYGRQILADNVRIKDKGKLYAGVKFNIINLELSKQVTRLEDLDGGEVGDYLRDEYDNNLVSSTDFGLDVGFVWDADWYRAGLTFANINSPDFSYGAIGESCPDRGDNNVERSSCEVTRDFIAEGRLRARETHTMHATMRVDGLVQLTDRWFVTSAMDLAKYDDFVGFENRWFHLATTFESTGRLLPSCRLGYQKNFAGEKLASYTFGFTFFKAFSLDFEWGAKSVDVDGDTVPRRVGFSLAFEEHF